MWELFLRVTLINLEKVKLFSWICSNNLPKLPPKLWTRTGLLIQAPSRAWISNICQFHWYEPSRTRYFPKLYRRFCPNKGNSKLCIFFDWTCRPEILWPATSKLPGTKCLNFRWYLNWFLFPKSISFADGNSLDIKFRSGLSKIKRGRGFKVTT